MTLTFLGQKYESACIALNSVETNLTGKYRGIATRFSESRPANIAKVHLTYRGVNYTR
ncbi:MAG: DUF4278 domain-containing protein [Oscillatoriales cyanobacterium C42_A2020_001]|nr:DUF4278 domain-containing protein [Leptolyngbyaceae cyanobacterium C42_A2020_001]